METYQEKRPSGSGNCNRITIILLVFLCLGLLASTIVLGVLYRREKNSNSNSNSNTSSATTTSASCTNPSASFVSSTAATRGQSVFASLSADEINAVRDYMLRQSSLRLASYDNATIDSNYIHSIDFEVPSKSAVLSYLNGSASEPSRYARVVLYNGAENPPHIKELKVGPLPISSNSTYMPIPNKFNSAGTYNWDSRPSDNVERAAYDEAVIKPAMRAMAALLNDSFGTLYYDDCKQDICITYSDSGPAGPDRDCVVLFYMNVRPIYANPIGLYFVIRSKGTNSSAFNIVYVVYNGQAFDSVTALVNAYNAGTVIKIPNRPLLKRLESFPYGADWAAMKVDPSNLRHLSNRPVPQLTEPGGKRYAVSGSHVQYLGWSVNLMYRALTGGVSLMDLRFKEERIAYEIGLGEAWAAYTGKNDILQAGSIYPDFAFGLAHANFELVKGVDCPTTASYLDLSHLADAGSASTAKNAICIFEHNMNVPLRRHYDDDFAGGYTFYAGLPATALVIRTISATFNYDYIFDYILHPNGAIELKTWFTGYLQASWWSPQMSPEESQYGNRVSDFTMGTLHDHITLYRIDLDIQGTANSLMHGKIGTELTTVADINGKVIASSQFTSNTPYLAKRITKEFVATEAGFNHNMSNPSVWAVVNRNANNTHRQNRGYRVMINNMIQNLQSSNPQHRASSWTKNNIAVSKHKDDELISTSRYDMHDGTGTVHNRTNPTPARDFAVDVLNGESVDNQDIVIWAAAGVHHVIHTEDNPVTTSNINHVSVLLKPFNYFDTDASLDLGNSVFIDPPKTEGGKPSVSTYGLDAPSCQATYMVPATDFYGKFV